MSQFKIHTIESAPEAAQEALKAADELAKENISVRVINCGTIKPLDGETILKAAKETKFIITAEEHSVIGGLGSAVSEFLSETHPTLVKKLGVYDKFGQSGKGAEMLEKYELTAAKLISMVKENLNPLLRGESNSEKAAFIFYRYFGHL